MEGPLQFLERGWSIETVLFLSKKLTAHGSEIIPPGPFSVGLLRSACSSERKPELLLAAVGVLHTRPLGPSSGLARVYNGAPFFCMCQKDGSKHFREAPRLKKNREHPPALEATQGQMDGFFSQPPYKCHQNRVASVGD